MVMDFGFLKDLMMQEIHAPCDHGLILWGGDYDVLSHLYLGRDTTPNENLHAWKNKLTQELHIPKWLKLYTMDTVPTAENLARHWHQRLEDAISHWHNVRSMVIQCRPIAMHVHETPNCVATYRPPYGSSSLVGLSGEGV